MLFNMILTFIQVTSNNGENWTAKIVPYSVFLIGSSSGFFSVIFPKVRSFTSPTLFLTHTQGPLCPLKQGYLNSRLLIFFQTYITVSVPFIPLTKPFSIPSLLEDYTCSPFTRSSSCTLTVFTSILFFSKFFLSLLYTKCSAVVHGNSSCLYQFLLCMFLFDDKQ